MSKFYKFLNLILSHIYNIIDIFLACYLLF